MTKFAELFTALNAPFSRVKTRSGGGGRQLSYITARQATIRLDEVIGPENWRTKYRVQKLAGDSGEYDVVICTLELRIDGEWIAKEGAGGFKEMTERARSGEQEVDEENTAKTGFSDALKRAASEWGVARDLYQDGTPSFSRDARTATTAAPAATQAPTRDDRPAPARPSGQNNGPPRSGKALFAWTKEMEQTHEVSLLKYINSWAKLQDYPGRMVDWDAEQVAKAHAEAVRKIESGQPSGDLAPATSGRDERTCWQLISDAAAKTNDAFFASHPDAGMPADAHMATGRLLWLAVQAGKSRYAATDDEKTADIIHAMEEVYVNHRQWVWAELKKVMAEAVRDAEKGVKV